MNCLQPTVSYSFVNDFFLLIFTCYIYAYTINLPCVLIFCLYNRHTFHGGWYQISKLPDIPARFMVFSEIKNPVKMRNPVHIVPYAFVNLSSMLVS